MKNLIIAYEFLDTDVAFIASHFDLIITYLSNAPKIQQIKALNSRIKAIYYQDAIAYFGDNPDFYVKGPNGEKLIHPVWDWPLADVSNPAYRLYLATKIKAELDANFVFDGVFLDDVWNEVHTNEFPAGSVPQILVDGWHEFIKALLTEIKAAIGTKLLIINTSLTWTLYTSLVDGQMYEFWVGGQEGHLLCAEKVLEMGKMFLGGTGGSWLTKEDTAMATKFKFTGTMEGTMEEIIPELPVQPTIQLSVDKSSIIMGETITLTWSSQNADDVLIESRGPDGGTIDSVHVGLNGSMSFKPPVIGNIRYQAASFRLDPDAGQLSAWVGVTVEVQAYVPPQNVFLTLMSDPNGAIWSSASSVPKGTSIKIEAVPKEGYVFDSWAGDVSGNINPTEIIMDSDKTISANYKAVIPPPPPVTYTCPIDGLVFSTQAELDAHTASAHPVTIQAPGLGSPKNGAVDVPTDTQILIYVIEGLSYTVQISTDSEFVNLIWDKLLSWPYKTSGLPVSTKLWYRVKAIDKQGNTSPWSEVWSFTTGIGPTPPPPSPNPTPSEPGSIPLTGAPALSAVKAVDASQYGHLAYAGWLRHESVSPDGQHITMQSLLYPAHHVFSASTFDLVKSIPESIAQWKDGSTDFDFRWADNESLYATVHGKFVKWNFVTDQITEIHDFRDDFPGVPVMNVTGREGGNPSSDNRYWAWGVVTYDPTTQQWGSAGLIVYDRETNQVISKLPPQKYASLFVGMSPSGNYVLVDSMTYGYDGIWVYSWDFSTSKLIPLGIPLDDATGHAFPGVGYDNQGREVLVAVEKKPGTEEFWVVMCDIETGEKNYIIYFGLHQHFNASCSLSKQGWAVVSNNGNGEIWLVELTKNPNPKKWVVCRTDGYLRVGHGDDQFAKLSYNGKIYFRANTGTPLAKGGDVSMYEVQLPADWDVKPLVPQYVVNDKRYYETSPMPKPEKGVPYRDRAYGTEVTRITDAQKDWVNPQLNYGYAYGGYVKHPVVNADGTMMILEAFTGSGWWVINANSPWNIIVMVPIPFDYWGNSQGSSDCRWDTKDPETLYFLAGPILYRFKPRLNERTIVHDFSLDFPGTTGGIGMMEEGNQSDDNRYWGFAWWESGKQTNLLCYDQVEDRVISKMPITEDTDSVSMSPSGKYLITGLPPVVLHNREDLTQIRKIGSHGHAAFGYSKEGKEVVVYAAVYFGPDGYTDMGAWLWMADLDTGVAHPLAPIGVEVYHVDMSAHLVPGWAIVSIFWPWYDKANPQAYARTKWYESTMFMIEVSDRILKPDMGNHTKIWNLVQTHHIYDGSYGGVPFGKFIDLKGTGAIWGVRWDYTSETDPVTGQKRPYDLFKISWPPNWKEDLK